MKSKILLLQFLISLSFTSINFAQAGNDVVASAGNNKITAQEFKARYELSPHLLNTNNEDSAKYKFLYSLIAEKLWADEAKNLGIEGGELFEFLYSPLKDMFARDALFNKEVKSQVNVTPEDISNGIKKYNETLMVDVIGSKDSNVVYDIYYKMKSGIPLDSAITKSKGRLDAQNHDEIFLGKLIDEDLEDMLYSLKPGEYTYPVENPQGWFLFYLKTKMKTVTDKNSDEIRKEVEKIITNRRIKHAYENYFAKVFSGKTLTPDKDLFWNIARKFDALFLLKKKEAIKVNRNPAKYYLTEGDVYQIKNEFGADTLNMTFVKIEGRNVTVSDFLASLLLEDFSVENNDPRTVNLHLTNRVKTFMQQQLLTQVAYKEGVQNSPEVLEQLKMWKNSYLAQIYKNKFIDSIKVSDDDVYNYYLEKTKNNQKVKEVNIIELFTDSLKIIDKVLNDLNEGKDFRTLAVKYTKRDWVKKRNGEFGPFPVTKFGEIGKIADKMNVGEIYGPLKIDGGYSLFKLVESKEAKDTLTKPFEQVKAQLQTELALKKYESKIKDATVKLADKYKIKINDKRLSQIPVSDINMFVHHIMGFGGKIAAVPFTSPFFEWINEAQKDVLP